MDDGRSMVPPPVSRPPAPPPTPGGWSPPLHAETLTAIGDVVEQRIRLLLAERALDDEQRRQQAVRQDFELTQARVEVEKLHAARKGDLAFITRLERTLDGLRAQVEAIAADCAARGQLDAGPRLPVPEHLWWTNGGWPVVAARLRDVLNAHRHPFDPARPADGSHSPDAGWPTPEDFAAAFTPGRVMPAEERRRWERHVAQVQAELQASAGGSVRVEYDRTPLDDGGSVMPDEMRARWERVVADTAAIMRERFGINAADIAPIDLGSAASTYAAGLAGEQARVPASVREQVGIQPPADSPQQTDKETEQ